MQSAQQYSALMKNTAGGTISIQDLAVASQIESNEARFSVKGNSLNVKCWKDMLGFVYKPSGICSEWY